MTLEKALDVISKLNFDGSKGLEQFAPTELEACDQVSQAIVDFNFHGAPEPEIPEPLLIKFHQVQDLKLAAEADQATF
ncbi:MAG: hypothetical protein R3F11_20835 [Verrucomicrobiales bacterium]